MPSPIAQPTQNDITWPTPEGGPIQFSDYTLDTSSPYAGGAAWVGGEYVPVAEARLPVLDAGYLHSDVTYSVAAVWHGSFFRLGDHIDRLLWGAERMGIRSPLTKDEIAEICHRCVALSQLRESYVSFSLSRGVVPRFDLHSYADHVPQMYVFAVPYRFIFDPELQINGARLGVARSVRRCGANQIDPRIKNFQWGDLIAAAREVRTQQDAHSAILLDTDGFVTEGPGFNVNIVKDGAISSAARNALPGITRRTTMDIAEELGVEFTLRDVSVSELYDADEIFATTTAGGVTPIIGLDGKPVGSGVRGPITTSILHRFWELHDHPSRYTDPVDYESSNALLA